MPQLKHTPFYDFHTRLHAKMVDFAGWDMPLLYRGIIDEHNHTRSAASIFDVSHMGRIKFSGPGAEKFLQHICTRNFAKGVDGQSMYSLVCNESGGILDDIIVSRYEKGGGHFLMVCNASNREKLLAWFPKHTQGFGVKIEDQTTDTAMIAIQGPKALEILDSVLPEPPSELRRYHFAVQRYMMLIQFSVFRSGYTGEDGCEIICSNAAAAMAVNFLLKGDGDHQILKPAGLGARDTLRMEAAMPLYGHELTESIDPLSAGLGWAVDLTKDFIGAHALRGIQETHQQGGGQRLVGLHIDGPRSARQDMILLKDGKPVGKVTSGCNSPTLKRCIAMAYIDAPLAAPGTPLTLDLRGNQVPATVTPLPFYKRPK